MCMNLCYFGQINASECLANTMRAVYWTQYIHFGCSLSSALTALPTQVDTEKEITEAKLFHKARDRFAASRCSYLLLPRVESDGKGLSVLLRSSAEPVRMRDTDMDIDIVMCLTAPCS